MKKMFNVLLTFGIFLFTIITPVHAVEPRYIPCPMGGRHPMEIVAKAFMYEGTYSNPGKRITPGGVYYRCKQCGLGLACQFSPIVAGYLGAYIFDSTNYNGSTIVYSYGVDGYEWSYPKGAMWDGMDWLD